MEKSHKHTGLPKYAPFHPYMNPELERNVHKNRDLLNYVVRGFYRRQDDDLNARQQDCKRFFVNLFNSRRQQGVYGQTVSDDDKEKYALRCSQDARRFMDHLDGFFFFGCLRAKLEVVAGFDVTSNEESSKTRPKSETVKCQENDRRLFRINLNIGQKNRVYKLNTIIGNLMYEMSHVWFASFACYENKCYHDIRNTMGFDGHGPIYQMLHRLILSEIRGWHEGLKSLLVKDCPGEIVSKRIRQWDEEATERVPDKVRKTQFNRLRSTNFGNNASIRIMANDEVVVRPALKHDQLVMEDYLLSRERRRPEIDIDVSEYDRKTMGFTSPASRARGKKQLPSPPESSSEYSEEEEDDGEYINTSDEDTDDENSEIGTYKEESITA